jgi:hypothetical protein
MKRFIFILHIALGLTFFSLALRAFLTPDDIMDTIKNSVMFAPIFSWIPSQIIGLHDIAMGILLIFRLFPKFTSAGSAIWIGTVIILLLSHMNLDGTIDAIEHAAPFGIALFLTFIYFKNTK